MDEHDSGPIQSGDQRLDMVPHPETEDKDAGRFGRIDSLSPLAGFLQGLMKTCQPSSTGDESDGRTIRGSLEFHGSRFSGLDSCGHFRSRDGKTGEVSLQKPVTSGPLGTPEVGMSFNLVCGHAEAALKDPGSEKRQANNSRDDRKNTIPDTVIIGPQPFVTGKT
jgi:hypothetical protein